MGSIPERYVPDEWKTITDKKKEGEEGKVNIVSGLQYLFFDLRREEVLG